MFDDTVQSLSHWHTHRNLLPIGPDTFDSNWQQQRYLISMSGNQHVQLLHHQKMGVHVLLILGLAIIATSDLIQKKHHNKHVAGSQQQNAICKKESEICVQPPIFLFREFWLWNFARHDVPSIIWVHPDAETIKSGWKPLAALQGIQGFKGANREGYKQLP